METQYTELFRNRKWKEAFDAMPLNLPKSIVIAPEDVVTIRVRASDYNRENQTRRVAVSIDYKTSTAIVTVRKK